VDPLKYNLFFERFLHMGRQDPPDIDVDFPWDEREKALAYVFRHYAGRAGMVADHVTFSHRSSLREAARGFGLGEKETADISRQWRRSRFGEVSGAGEGEEPPGEIPPYLLRAAAALMGLPRHLGTHPGGVVITPEPLYHYTCLIPSGTGVPVIPWEKDGAEESGLVKIDLLGNRSLGVLRDSLEMVNQKRAGQGLSGLTWEGFSPLEDRATRRFIETGDTLGIFYVESPATRQLLKKMGRGDYEHLVIASSIIRPAANRWIGEFIRRLRGGGYEPLPGPVEETLRETKGIMVYQEDVARVAMAAAGFNAVEADGLRKILSKKDRHLRLESYRLRFLQGTRGRGIPESQGRHLWEGILSFEGYSFCKAHSASYAQVSYRLAWLKLHYPLEFFTAVINNGGGFYSRQVYLNALRRQGFSLLPPDVNRSGLSYRTEGEGLRVGLGQLKDVPRDFLRRLLEDRTLRGEFRDLPDLFRRLQPRFPEMRVLIRSGALDGVAGGLSRPRIFWLYYHRSRILENSLFSVTAGAGGGPDADDTAVDFPPLEEYSEQRRIADEAEHLQLILSRHPLELYGSRIRRFSERTGCGLVDSRTLSERGGKKVWIAGSLVTEKETRTKSRQIMCFVSFEDSHGLFETVFFPDVYGKYAALLMEESVFLMEGTVEEDFGVFQLEVERLISLSSPGR
jgi:error-prone DNA polymerase